MPKPKSLTPTPTLTPTLIPTLVLTLTLSPGPNPSPGPYPIPYRLREWARPLDPRSEVGAAYVARLRERGVSEPMELASLLHRVNSQACTCRAHAMHTPCTRHAHAMYMPCIRIHHANTMHILSTMHMPCTRHACACTAS